MPGGVRPCLTTDFDSAAKRKACDFPEKGNFWCFALFLMLWEAIMADLEELFRWLHRHPELAFEEAGATAQVRELLTQAGLAVQDGGLPTGLIAQVEGALPGPTVALRCDMDALPIQEQTGLPYASETPGCMHACGHDFHTAVITGAALRLQDMRNEIYGRVKILFQPAEEVATGAQRMIDTGLTDADCYIGIHSYPAEDPGWLGIKEGPVMAAIDRFQVTLTGRGCHGAQPHKGTDPIPALAALVSALQTVVSRNADPFAPCLLSVTHVESGSTWNVIPEVALLEGTIRTLNAGDRAMMRRRFHEVTEGTAAAYGVKAAIEWFSGPPAVVNDAALCRLARKVALRCGYRVGRQEDTLGGEDFSLYLDKAPGIFIRVGTGGGYPGHHPRFSVNPAAIVPAADYFAQLAIACGQSSADE